jgi:hypothetical protein
MFKQRKIWKMATNPIYSTAGSESEKIDVRLSYGIVRLFSEGLYASPNKAVEELVANSFDAGARRVAVLLPADFNDQGATIVVVDDGEGMDAAGLKTHWLIGKSFKRALQTRPLAFAAVAECCLKLWPVGILSAGLVFEQFVERDAVELPRGVLIDSGHAFVADFLSVHLRFLWMSG